MPNLHEISKEIRAGHGAVRARYLTALHEKTGRNIILYYSGWLQKPGAPGLYINDLDMNGFKAVIPGLSPGKGLDLILHTPGGEVAATEAIVDYLRAKFGANIRVIVPQLAMSAGTMIACAAKEVLMGKHSSLGPIDPQIGNVAAQGVVQEFKRAHKEIKKDPSKIAVWRPIIAQYHPTLVGECEQWIAWANEMAREWLETGMLKGRKMAKKEAKRIVDKLTNPGLTKSHSRHLSAQFCKKIGMTVEMMESDQKLQDAVLSLHHACMLTLMETASGKIIANHNGVEVEQRVVRRGGAT